MFGIFTCCGKTGKPVVKAIAFIDLIVAIAIVLIGLLVFAFFSEDSTDDKKVNKTPGIVVIILFFIFFFLEACLFSLLRSAGSERDPAQCHNWFMIRLILLVILVFGVIFALMSSVNVNEIYLAGFLCLLIVLYRVYTLMTVRAFYLEIVASKQLELGQGFQRVL